MWLGRWWGGGGDEIAVLQTRQDGTDCTSPDLRGEERPLDQPRRPVSAALSVSLYHTEGWLT